MEDLINKLNLDNPYREKFEKDLQDKINMSKDLLNNFDFEMIRKMTIMNSHGDYSVQQLIYNDNGKTTVIDFETAKSSRRCTAWYGKPAFCTLLYAGFACQLLIQQSIFHTAVNCFTKHTSKIVFCG